MDENTKLEIGDSAYWENRKWTIIDFNASGALELKCENGQFVHYYSKELFLTNKNWTKHDIRSLKQSNNDDIVLKVGDTFRDSNYNLVEIEDAYPNICYGRVHRKRREYSCNNVIFNIRSGKYTNYVSVNSKTMKDEEWIPKVGDWVTIIKDGYGATTDGTGQIERIEGKNHCMRFKGILHRVWKQGFRKALPHEIPTQPTKQWKKEDFYNTKIIVDTPEKSKKFQEFALSLGFKSTSSEKTVPYQSVHIYLYDNLNMTHDYVFLCNNWKKHKNREIFYDDIFNNNSITTINNNQNGKTENNDVFGENLSGSRSSEKATAIPFRKTGTIASSSGYTGNRIQGRTIKAGIRESEVSFTAVAA